jgi:hypothetical protein
MAAVSTHLARTRTSDAVRADMLATWRIRCTALEEKLEEKLQDTTAALRRSETERRELSLDYKHVLDKLWRQNAGLTTRRER